MVSSQKFDYLIVMLVLVNSALIGIEVDFVAKHPGQPVPVIFRVCEVGFALAFSTEIILKLLAYQFDFFFMRGWPWNIFDVCLVVTQVIDAFLMTFVGSGSLALRMVRLIRAVRSIRVLRHVNELRTLIACITLSLKSFLSSLLLLTLMIFIEGVWFTEIVSSHRSNTRNVPVELEAYFGTLSATFMSLYQSVTGGLDWKDAVMPLADISPFLAVAFVFYIAFAVLAVLNTITGAFVQSALTSAKEDKDTFMMNLLISDLFSKNMDDFNDTITADDFKGKTNSPQMLEYFKAIDVEPSDGASEGIFRLIDRDERGWVTPEEFLTGCMRLRGNAKALDLALLIQMVKRMADTIQIGQKPTTDEVYDFNDEVSLETPSRQMKKVEDPEDALVGMLQAELRSPRLSLRTPPKPIYTGSDLRDFAEASNHHMDEPPQDVPRLSMRTPPKPIYTGSGPRDFADAGNPYMDEPMIPFSPITDYSLNGASDLSRDF